MQSIPKKRCDPAAVSAARERAPRQTIETIIKSANHYLAAVKGNQPKLYQAVQDQFVEHDSFNDVFKGHGRIEKRKVSTAYLDLKLSEWSRIKTLIKKVNYSSSSIALTSFWYTIDSNLTTLSRSTSFFVTSLLVSVKAVTKSIALVFEFSNRSIVVCVD